MDVLDEEVKEFQMKLEAIIKEFLEQGSIGLSKGEYNLR